MKLHVTFDMDNAAFDDAENEVGKILTHIKDQFDAGAREGLIRDTNGNKVGMWYVSIAGGN